MNGLLIELKVPTLAGVIFLAVLTIARAHANFFQGLENVRNQIAIPLIDDYPSLQCGYQPDEPLDLNELFAIAPNDE